MKTSCNTGAVTYNYKPKRKSHAAAIQNTVETEEENQTVTAQNHENDQSKRHCNLKPMQA